MQSARNLQLWLVISEFEFDWIRSNGDLSMAPFSFKLCLSSGDMSSPIEAARRSAIWPSEIADDSLWGVSLIT